MDSTREPEKPEDGPEKEPVSKQEKRRQMVEAQEDAAISREEEGGYQ